MLEVEWRGFPRPLEAPAQHSHRSINGGDFRSRGGSSRIHPAGKSEPAYAAGLAVNFFSGLDELRANWAVDQTWMPHFEEAERERLYKQWKKAVTRSFDWVES